jgi:hypothetical protein
MAALPRLIGQSDAWYELASGACEMRGYADLKRFFNLNHFLPVKTERTE